MSIETIAYVKSLDLGKHEKSRLLLYIIAENTLDDADNPLPYTCRVGVEELALQIRVDEKTVRRHLEELSRRRAKDGRRLRPIILRKRRYPKYGGRLNDALRIVGYKRWYICNYGAVKRKHKAKNRVEIGERKSGTLPDKMSGITPGQRVSAETGQQMSATYNRTLSVSSEDARPSAQDDSISDFEVKAVLDRIRQELGSKVFDSWFPNVSVRRDDLRVSFEAPKPFIRDWIRDKYGNLIRRLCDAQWPRVSVDFTVSALMGKP